MYTLKVIDKMSLNFFVLCLFSLIYLSMCVVFTHWLNYCEGVIHPYPTQMNWGWIVDKWTIDFDFDIVFVFVFVVEFEFEFVFELFQFNRLIIGQENSFSIDFVMVFYACNQFQFNSIQFDSFYFKWTR